SQLLALCMKDHGKELSPECIKDSKTQARSLRKRNPNSRRSASSRGVSVSGALLAEQFDGFVPEWRSSRRRVGSLGRADNHQSDSRTRRYTDLGSRGLAA